MNAETLTTHAEFLRRITRGLLADESRVDDVLQQTWLAALRRSSNSPASRSWLGKVAVNFARRSLREDSRRARREEAVGARHAAPITPDEVVAREATVRAVVDAVFALEEPYRSTILRRYYDDLTPTRIARLEGIPVETVRTRLKRGLRRLRAELDSHDDRSKQWRSALLPLAAASWAPTGPGVAASLVAGVTLLVVVGVSSLPRGSSGDDQQPPLAALASGMGHDDELGELDNSGSTAAAAAAVVAGTGNPPATMPPATTGSIAMSVTWPDGTPAAGIRTWLHSTTNERQPVPLIESIETKSNTSGRVSIDSLQPGRYRVSVDRGASTWISVEAGKTTSGKLRIREGEDIEGTVLDVDGRPVAGAEVVLSLQSEPGRAAIATSAEDGGFMARHLPRKAFIGARSPGFAASEMLPVHDRGRTADAPVMLTLGAAAAIVEGVVVDQHGSPVAGAGVIIGQGRSLRATTGWDGRRTRAPDPFRARTDGDGRFRFDSTPAGRWWIEAAAPGLSPWRGEIEAPAETVVTLRSASYVIGTVRDSDGAPVGHARIHARPEEGRFASEIRRFLTSYSDDDGNYRVGPVAGTSLVVEAMADQGKASATFLTAPDETIRWDPRLDRGAAIRGIVVDTAGAPLAGWSVEVSRATNGFRSIVHRTRTAKDGSFTAPNLEAETYRLDLTSRELRAPQATHRVDDLQPADGWARIVVPDETRSSARIRGEIADTDESDIHRPIALQAWELTSQQPISVPIAGAGAFDVGPIPPGTYRLSLYSPDLGRRDLGVARLRQRETHELGTLRLPQPGQVALHIRRDDGEEIDYRLVTILDEHLRHASRVVLHGGIAHTSTPLSPGLYHVEPRQHGTASTLTPFRVASNETTTVDIRLEAAKPRHIAILLPDAEAASWHVTTRVFDSGGNLVHGYSRAIESPRRPSTTAFLTPGVYTVEAEVAWGKDAQSQAWGTATFEVDGSSTRLETVEVQLR